MGMDHKVSFRREKTPSWAQLKEALASRNLSLELRMIDGELAFPDETPPDTWRELRVGTPSGMITLRREIDGVTLVIWGNADENLRRDWNTLADVLRELVET
jgi:hypothetical protein